MSQLRGALCSVSEKAEGGNESCSRGDITSWPSWDLSLCLLEGGWDSLPGQARGSLSLGCAGLFANGLNILERGEESPHADQEVWEPSLCSKVKG